MIVQQSLFDYAVLDTDTRAFVQEKAQAIHTRLKRTAEDIIAIGEDLIEVKARLQHGQFQNWLQTEFEMTYRTALNFMRVAEKLGNKSEIISLLPVTILFALETYSCTVAGREKEGWMYYAQADYLLYAFAQPNDSGLKVYLIDFPKLREWFWNLPQRYEVHTMDTLNRTRFEKVPIVDVRKAVPTWRYLITSEGCQFIPKRSGK